MIELLKQIKNEPDLQDFIEYCIPVLQKISDIQNKMNYLSIQNKVKSINVDINYRLDSIINKYIPQSVQSYLNLTFEYRNTKKIKVDNQEITPKEALLHNLRHISRQVDRIEEEFNEENKLSLIVQNRLLREMPQPEIISDDNFINQFDISNFKTKTKNLVSEPINEPSIETPQTQPVTYTKPADAETIGVIMFVIIFFSIVLSTIIYLGESKTELSEQTFSTSQTNGLFLMHRQIVSLKERGLPVNTDTVRREIPQNALFNGNISITESYDSYSIHLQPKTKEICESLISNGFSLFTDITSIQTNNKIVPNIIQIGVNPSAPDFKSKISSGCQLSPEKPRTIIFTGKGADLSKFTTNSDSQTIQQNSYKSYLDSTRNHREQIIKGIQK